MLLGFCVSATKGFYPGPGTALFLPSAGAGRAGRGALGALGPSCRPRDEVPRLCPGAAGRAELPAPRPARPEAQRR